MFDFYSAIIFLSVFIMIIMDMLVSGNDLMEHDKKADGLHDLRTGDRMHGIGMVRRLDRRSRPVAADAAHPC